LTLQLWRLTMKLGVKDQIRLLFLGCFRLNLVAVFCLIPFLFSPMRE